MSSQEEGSVSVLTIGFLLVLVLLVAVVVDASDAYLERQQLANLADGAALTAADGLDEDAFYSDQEVRLDAGEAARLVGDYLSGSGARVASVSVGAERISVRLERRLDLALVPPGWDGDPVVVAEASAALRADR